ncbi:MAG: restriction endonuclease [Methylococcales bacterium]|nr:restriction endonuclease [Methylococcales bacterium]
MSRYHHENFKPKKKKTLIDSIANFLNDAKRQFKIEMERANAEAIKKKRVEKERKDNAVKRHINDEIKKVKVKEDNYKKYNSLSGKRIDTERRTESKTEPKLKNSPLKKNNAHDFPFLSGIVPTKQKLTKSLLLSIDWKNYENVCIEYLRIRNWKANGTGNGADGGIDITINSLEGKLVGIAQCKAWKKQIGVNLVRELFGVMASEGVEKGIFFTTSTFTPDAKTFCVNKKLYLIDCNELINRMNKLEESHQVKLLAVATSGNYTTPTCAKCNVKMTIRVSKKGSNIGREFWGCVNFPRCRSIINKP